MKRLTTGTFIAKARTRHGTKYDYSLTEYINSRTKLKIICYECGVFEQIPGVHFNHGCPKCSIKNRVLRTKKSIELFREEAQSKHGLKYNYNTVQYKNTDTPVEIICPEHGSFTQRPAKHLNGSGCPKCAKKYMDVELFKEKAQSKHGLKYNYNNVQYKNTYTPVEIICPEHGSFMQRPAGHMKGHGCPKCKTKRMVVRNTYNTKKFLGLATTVHGHLYDYSNIRYTSSKTKIAIVCPKHGVFYQTPNAHLMGHGCSRCSKHGFDQNKPAILYYIKDQETNMYKIGITNNSLETRFGKGFCSVRIITLMEQSYENGQDAYLAEQEILQAFRHYRCTNDSWPQEKGGRTEFFDRDILKIST